MTICQCPGNLRMTQFIPTTSECMQDEHVYIDLSKEDAFTRLRTVPLCTFSR